MTDVQFDDTLDTQGLNCPMPVVKARKKIGDLDNGQVLRILSTDRGSIKDFQGWAKIAKNVDLLAQETETENGDEILRALRPEDQLKETAMSVSDVTSGDKTVTPETLQEQLTTLEQSVENVEESLPEDKIALIVFSGDVDRVLAAFVIANGAAAFGQEVSMFFTFWGLNVLKKNGSLAGKSAFPKMMSVMSPEPPLSCRSPR